MDFSKLPPEIQAQLIKLAMKGKPETPDNQNRARMLLQNNPDLVKRLVQENGIDNDDSYIPGQDDDTDDSDDNAALDDDADDATLTDKKLGLD